MKFNKNSKIYIAGHLGMVGSAILRNMLSQGYDKFALRSSSELDLRNQSEVESFFEEQKPDVVFLAAAMVGGIVANKTYKADFIYDNLMIASNVIDASYKFGVKKLLNLGSSCIFPKLAPQPMKEEYLLTGELEPTNESYALAKIAAIKLCDAYNFQHGTDFISVMPTNLYGPNDNYNLETSHVFSALIRKFILAKALEMRDYDFIKSDIEHRKLGFGLDEKINLSDKKSINSVLAELGITADSIALWGTGEVYREFLHVEDLADACVYLMENHSYEDVGEFVNIGTGKDITIKRLAEKIKDKAGFTGGIVFDDSKPDGTPKKLLDVTRLRNLGWEAKIGLDEGIESMIEKY